MIEEIFDLFKVNDVEYRKDVRLAEISPVKIGGRAKAVVYPDSTDKLLTLLRSLNNEKIEHKTLGRMSNVLPSDENYEGIIVKTDRLASISIYGCEIDVDGGVSLPILAGYAAKAGFSGLEELSGIPGSLGGSIRGNAGAFGREISRLVSWVKAYDPVSDSVAVLDAKELDFGYRNSSFKKNSMIILSARLRLVPSDSAAITFAMRKYKEIRKATQPVGEPSLGSVFKRPGEDLYAAKMVDECGLKGKSIGGARISEKHAGFILNSGSATAKDFISLADYAQMCVYNKFKVTLEREIEIM